jgi:hypothetical protein
MATAPPTREYRFCFHPKGKEAHEQIDKAQEKASEWEEENFHTIGCVIVFDRSDVEELSKMCNAVLSAAS